MQSLGLSLASGRATAARAIRDGKQLEQMEIKRISMKPEGLDISRYMPVAEPAECVFFSPEDISLAQIEEILSVITSFETVLFENRKNIEAIKVRREKLVQECRELSISLQSASSGLTKQFEDVMKDLRANLAPIGGPTPPRESDGGGLSPNAGPA